MSLATRLSRLTEVDQLQLLDVAANAKFRELLILEIATLNQQLANLAPPSLMENAVQFLVEYRQIQQERNQLQTLVSTLSTIVSNYSQENDNVLASI